MKRFHWGNCKKEIEDLNLHLVKSSQRWNADQQKITALTTELEQEKLKHSVALQGITINENVANELQKKVAHLEHELKELSTAYTFMLEQNKKLQGKKNKNKSDSRITVVMDEPTYAA